MEPLSLDRRVQRGQLSPAQLFRRLWLVRQLLLISHHESETLFRVFRLCASMNQLPTFFFTPPCTPRLAWLRPTTHGTIKGSCTAIEASYLAHQLDSCVD